MKQIEIKTNYSPSSYFKSIIKFIKLYPFPSSIGVVISMSAVCSTSKRGDNVSLKSCWSMRAASSMMIKDPPVPFVPE
jgi:hypothetical protein